jgi:N-acetylglucosaminyldiphosphoundecaprenol N-acetyl-beta-D-mannosaminyltransferase
MKRDFPHIEVCGVYSPPFKEILDDDDDREIIRRVNNAKPDVLWVGMTAPKQEKWIYKNRGSLDVSLAGAIGAVFDFYAGTKNRAPEWVCRLGLEWLPRLLREPRRLFKRNFISSPLFLLMVLQEKLKKSAS